MEILLILLIALFVIFWAILALLKGFINNILYKLEHREEVHPESPKKGFNPEWVWVEERKLWVHKSELEEERHNQHVSQTDKKTDGSYHYRGKDITNEWIKITNNKVPKPEHRKKPTFTEPKYQPPKTEHIWESVEWKQRPNQGSRPYKQTQSEQPKTNPIPQNENTTKQYEAKSILTYNEKRNYKTLKEAADKKGYTVNLKPRIADIANSRIKNRKDKQFWINFNKISQKHVDFAILDANLNIIAVIELDDSSHDTPKARERDAFKDSVLKDCGYKVIHTRYIWPDILDNI